MKSIKKLLKTSMLALSFTASEASYATVVQFQTRLGDIEVNLYDEGTPETVENFLYYVSEGAYTDSLIHRVVPGFVVQGGGFNIASETIDRIPSVTSPINEPKYSSVKGTIAMAKLGGDPNSATNQWFFNLSENSSILDTQNGGFTVFGEVVSGMDVVEAIADLNRYDFRILSSIEFFEDAQYKSAFTDTPLVSFSQDDIESFLTTPSEFLVTINAIVVLDAAPDTASTLNLVPNTLLSPKKKKKKWFGSSDVSLLCLLSLFALGMAHRNARKHAI